MQQLFEQAVRGGFSSTATQRALVVLANAQRLRRVRPAGDASAIGNLINAAEPAVEIAAIQLAGVWRLQSQAELLCEVAARRDASAAQRIAAINALAEIGGNLAAETLVALTAAANESSIRKQATLALSGLADDRAAAPFCNCCHKCRMRTKLLICGRGF